MRIRYTIVRALAGLIDLILIYVPTVLLFSFWFRSGIRMADILAQIIFVVYNVVAVTGFQGRTFGKYFARMRVSTVKMLSGDALFVGMRELTKILYLTPVIGVPMLFINLIICLFTGRMIEDFVGQSDVIIAQEEVIQEK